jgi:glycosyltransferase involved in cell wall biosynthesis
LAVLRILQFADIVNRYDFIDNIVRYADPGLFHVGVCVRSLENNIADPCYTRELPFFQVAGPGRAQVPRASYELAAILRKWNVDVLHTHHYDQAVIGLLATRLFRRTRLVVGRHYSDAIYRSSFGMKRRVLLGLESVVNRSASRIVVPSCMIRDILTSWQGINANKIDLVPYGFVPAKYQVPPSDRLRKLRSDLGLNGRCVFGTFSRLHEEKGHRFLLKAVACLRPRWPNLTLLVVGEGPERAALERQVSELGLESIVRFLGWRNDIIDLMAMVDAVVQPTLQEAFSQVMIEALWMGKPLVITDVSGATDLIDNGRNGLLVPKADSQALGSAIEKLAADESLRKSLGAAGHAFVQLHLSVEKVIPRYERVYLRAMKRCS